MLIADSLFRTGPAKQLGDICEVGVGVADVEEGLGGALGRAYDLDADAFLALEVLDGVYVVSVPGDEDVGIGVGGEAHHVDDDAYVPVALVGDGLLPRGGKCFVHDERLGAYLVAELVEVVDEGARRGRALRLLGLLLLDDVERCPQELSVPDGRGEKPGVVQNALVVVLDRVVEVGPVDEHGDPFCGSPFHSARILAEIIACSYERHSLPGQLLAIISISRLAWALERGEAARNSRSA